jgi:hypothetical protein
LQVARPVDSQSCDKASGDTRANISLLAIRAVSFRGLHGITLRLPSRKEHFLSREAVEVSSSVATRGSSVSMSDHGVGNGKVMRRRALDICGQAIKGAWGMSWRQKTMTGVEDCEKSGVVVKQTLIPEFPN